METSDKMNQEDLKKKDWQLLTAYSDISALSYLETILQNQAFIISKLNNQPLKEVTELMSKYQKENYKNLLERVKTNIPDYPDTHLE